LEASFSKSFRGYDVSEVDAYVQSVQNFETESQNALAKSNQKTAELKAEVARLREIESSLFRALKLAEESQQNFSAKMEKEAKSILDKANKEAEAIKKKADSDAQKQALLTENERKQTLAQANQELKEQERQLRNLQEAQKEIASQLKSISEQTLGSIANWLTTDLVAPIALLAPAAPTTTSKRGRKPGVKNKPKTKVKAKAKVKPPVKEKIAKEKVVKAKPAPKAKPADKAIPAKRGPKPKAKPEALSAAKPAVIKTEKPAPSKRGPKPKISLETVSDEGLPTLNKVLEAYAKSSGPRGKVGEIN
jgi:cell division initiation protein